MYELNPDKQVNNYSSGHNFSPQKENVKYTKVD